MARSIGSRCRGGYSAWTRFVSRVQVVDGDFGDFGDFTGGFGDAAGDFGGVDVRISTLVVRGTRDSGGSGWVRSSV